jgi:hypothetical protein
MVIIHDKKGYTFNAFNWMYIFLKKNNKNISNLPK